MTDDEITTRIRELVAAAPPLTPEQRSALAELLRPARITAYELAG